jgi:hypothetical protein
MSGIIAQFQSGDPKAVIARSSRTHRYLGLAAMHTGEWLLFCPTRPRFTCNVRKWR